MHSKASIMVIQCHGQRSAVLLTAAAFVLSPTDGVCCGADMDIPATPQQADQSQLKLIAVDNRSFSDCGSHSFTEGRLGPTATTSIS